MFAIGEGSFGDSPVYAGTAYGLDEIDRSQPATGFVAGGCVKSLFVIDLPFSFVLDTILLPITIPWYLLQ